MENELKEIWIPVENYEKFYEISNIGRVKRLSRSFTKYGKNKILYPKIMKPTLTAGYRTVGFQINGTNKHYKIHRLIAKAFIPNPENKPFINHINGIKTDNRIENLEWCTHSENIKHAYKIGLLSPLLISKNGMNKLSTEDVILIRNLHKNGIQRKNIALKFNISPHYINDLVRGRARPFG